MGNDEAATITVASTPEQVDALRPLWEDVRVPDMDADPDYLLTVVGAQPGCRPHVVAVERPGRGPLLAVGRVAQQDFPVKVGYRVVARPQARAMLVSFDGLLGCEGTDDVRLLLEALRESLDQDRVAVIWVQKTPVGGAVDAVTARTTARWRRKQSKPVRLWRADLPESWDALLAARSSKSRRQLRYDDNKVRRRFGDRLDLRRLDLAEHADRLRGDLDAVASRSYQQGLGVSVFGDPVQQALLHLAARHGWLRVWMLYVDDRPVAFWWGIAYRGVFTIMSPGFLPEFAADRVGYFTLRRMLEDLCTDPAVQSLSFGPGDAEYKERFGTEHTDVADVLLFAAGPRGSGLNATVRLNDRIDRAGRQVLEWSGKREQLRRRFRPTASAGTGAPATPTDATPDR